MNDKNRRVFDMGKNVGAPMNSVTPLSMFPRFADSMTSAWRTYPQRGLHEPTLPERGFADWGQFVPLPTPDLVMELLATLRRTVGRIDLSRHPVHMRLFAEVGGQGFPSLRLDVDLAHRDTREICVLHVNRSFAEP